MKNGMKSKQQTSLFSNGMRNKHISKTHRSLKAYLKNQEPLHHCKNYVQLESLVTLKQRTIFHQREPLRWKCLQVNIYKKKAYLHVTSTLMDHDVVTMR